MKESDLKRPLVKLLREVYPNFIIWRIEDPTTSGIPDIIVVGNKISSYWEVKRANPHFKSKGVQELTMLRLARHGLAFYIVYYEHAAEKRTYIVDPKDVGKPILDWSDFVIGFDHHWIAKRIGDVHDRIRS